MSKIVRKHNDIWEYHDIIKNPYEIIESLQDRNWGNYTNKGGGETVQGRLITIWDNNEHFANLSEAFVSCIEEYCTENNLLLTKDNIGLTWLLIREYNAGSSMSAHSDMYSYLTKNSEKVKPELTAIIYLNDNYFGGQINFVNDELCITPKAGSLVIFPSNKIHEVLQINEGNRYMTQVYVYPNVLSFYDKDPNVP
jgi:hypothetical protein